MRAGWPATLSLLLLGGTVWCCSPTGEQNERSGLVGQWLFFVPQEPVERAAVVGEFNLWDPQDLALEDSVGDGVLRAWVELPPGTHHYRIWADGQTFLDRFNPLTLFDKRGVENSVLLVEDPAQPVLVVESFTAEGDGHLQLELSFRSGSAQALLDPQSIQASLSSGDPLGQTWDPEKQQLSLWADQLAPGKHRLSVGASDESGRECAPLVLPFWIEAQAFDWRDAVIYQVVVDRFRSGAGALEDQVSISYYRGGDLAGVIQALEDDYFAGLGVNVLWLSPLYQNPEGEFVGRDGHPAQAYHGYWPSHPRSVESRFGGQEDLRELVRVAHGKGIRVIMDAVLNHLHQEHPYAQAHMDAGWFNHPQGDCVCGFTCSWGEFMDSCWFDPFLPDLRFQNSEVLEQQLDDAQWWIEHFDLDGLRLDAVPMMPRLVLRHLRHRLRTGLERSGVQVYLLGETYTGRGGQGTIRYYLGEHTLSGQFDFPVMWALREALSGGLSLAALDDEVSASEQAWSGSGAVMAPFLGNHDVPRFISVVNGDAVHHPRDLPPPTPDTDEPYDLLRLAWSFIFAQPGAPIVYYGDEIGLPGANDPDNRRNMLFGDDLSARQEQVLQHVRRLGKARGCSRALRRGIRQTLLVEDDIYAVGRDAGDGYPALVVMNRGATERQIRLSIPADWTLAQDAQFEDMFDAPVTLDGRELRLSVAARTSALVLCEPRCDGV